MGTTLRVVATQRTRKDATGWEGKVDFPGLNGAKVARKDGTTLFGTVGALTSAAKSLAKRVGSDLDLQQPATKAAKKSVKKATKTKKTSS